MATPTPPAPPLPQHLHIVALEAFYTPLPEFVVPPPHTFTLTQYERTPLAETAARIADADIVITTVAPLSAAVLAADCSPRLRLVAVMASGTDTVDLAACRARGIRVLNSPHCNTTALAEHVAALYLAARRSLVPVMRATVDDAWTRKGTVMDCTFTCGQPPPSIRDETLAIVGYGGVGKAVAALLGGLGMAVVVAGRKGADVSPSSPPSTSTSAPATPPRVSFDDALARATVLVVCCPRLPETMALIDDDALARMRPDAILINVSRGGVVVETALVAALRAGRLAGAGIDVFDHEPADRHNSPVVAAAAQNDLNLIVTAHTAWVAASTRANYQRTVRDNVEQFLRGTMVPERIRV